MLNRLQQGKSVRFRSSQIVEIWSRCALNLLICLLLFDLMEAIDENISMASNCSVLSRLCDNRSRCAQPYRADD